LKQQVWLNQSVSSRYLKSVVDILMLLSVFLEQQSTVASWLLLLLVVLVGRLLSLGIISIVLVAVVSSPTEVPSSAYVAAAVSPSAPVAAYLPVVFISRIPPVAKPTSLVAA
jgi:hypothetical protein